MPLSLSSILCPVIISIQSAKLITLSYPLNSHAFLFCLPVLFTGIQADAGPVITDKLGVVSFASLFSRVKVRQSTACVSLYTSLLSGFFLSLLWNFLTHRCTH